MSDIPYNDGWLAESAGTFAEAITPAKARWEYCADRSSYVFHSQKYGRMVSTNSRTVPVAARVLGVSTHRVKLNFQKLRRANFDAARAEANAIPSVIFGDRFGVGPMQAWQVGHLYFARVKSHPHVVKVGFSRRVRERFDDIASKAKASLVMLPGEIRAGTLCDEHWWHKNWSDYRISGEWFFDPHASDRSLPKFLEAAPLPKAA